MAEEEKPKQEVEKEETKKEEKIVDTKKEVKEKPEAPSDSPTGRVARESAGGTDTKPFKRETREEREKREIEAGLAGWEPKTKLGRDVKDGKIKNIDEILDSGDKILEAEIVDFLMDIKSDLINIGQSKGKFGGGKRRIWRQTQRKTKEGNVPTFSTLAVIGDGNGHIGIGSGRSSETLPAREKAIRKAKLEIFKIKRACSGFDCSCPENHTVPFKVIGKAGSLRLTLIPAAQGTGLVVADELKKVLRLTGIKDVYSKGTGKKRTTFNLVKACIDALKKTNK
jgi:small subunit ribosomal protein S5